MFKKASNCVQELFEARAAARPEALALAWDGGSLTYGEMNARANRLARHLRGLGVGPEVPVGVLARRSPEMLVAILAVLKAGGCYLPLDPAYPEERLATTLADAGALLLLSTSELMAARPSLSLPAFLLDADWESLSGSSGTDLEPLAAPHHLAYVIYTSGSTGRPKGVEVEHRGLSNLVDWHRRTYGVGPEDRATRLAGSAFDASVWEVWPYLASGASLHLPPDELLLSPPELARWLAREEITLCFLPTPLAEAVLEEPWPPGSRLRALLTGGDRLHRGPSPEHPFGLYNHYGPTENSVVTTWCRVMPGQGGLPPIGRAIDGVETRVMGPDLLPAMDGEEGELWTGGASLARGYRGRPELTAERFVPDPFAAEPGARLYRTGDLVRTLATGDLDFVGRIDFQVKVRGFRIELGEIEAALRRHPRVREGVVLAREDGRGGQRLVGYVVPRERGEGLTAELEVFLGRSLPEYMVPAAWVVLAALPLTPNGKVDRAALPEPERETAAGAAPRTAREEALAAVFAEVLGLERVGVEEDFFALGGHSLQATRVASRLRSRLGVELSPAALFAHPTVESLARALAETGEAGLEIRPLPRGGEVCELPLSFAQQRLWVAERWSPEPALYNTPFALGLSGPLDVAALRRSVAEIVDRHETLRSRFREVDGRPVLEVLRHRETELPLCDLSALPAAAREAEAERISTQEAHRPFDLERGPLLRTVLLRLGGGEHRLLALMHHIVSDDWSISVLARELAALYGAFSRGLPSPLPPLAAQYGDFAAWQRQWLSGGAGEVLERQLGWWREALRPPLPVLELPTDRPRPALQTFRGARLRRVVPRERLEALAAVGRGAEASLFMVLLAAVDALLARSAGAEDVMVGAPIANRNRVEVEELIGFFVNTLVLRSRVDAGAGFLDLLGAARATLLGAYEHQDLPFERLVEELAPDRDLSRGPLVDVMVVLANALSLPERLGPDLRLEVRELEVGVAKMDLSLFLEEGPAGLSVIWEYNTALFDRATVKRMAGHLETLLGGIAESPETAVGDLPLLTAAERSQLAAWNAEPARRERPLELPGATLHGLFEAQAARTPDAIALIDGNERLSYAELAARSGELAGVLRGLGVGPEVPVGIFLERKAGLIVALLATLRAGGFYVPLDPNYPAERVGFMLGDSGCAVVLTTSELEGHLPGTDARIVRLDEEIPAAPVMAVPPALPGNLAYVIYTSGSTGRPKAVAIEHRSVVALMLWSRREYSDLELSGVLASTSITFDMSVFEIFAPLCWGGTVILAGNALALPGLAMLPADHQVRVVDTVPSAMAELLRMGGVPDSVVTVNLGGEAVPRALADRVHDLPAVERLYNVYGPSEDTTFSTWALIDRSDRPVSIGRPLDGEQAWVVDRHFNPVPVGVPGELFLAGAGLSRGYLGRPELTAERFLPDPFSTAPGARMYRVGDLVRYRADGEMEYLGRLDHQVKIRGFRVELGEVEAALGGLPGVETAVVLAREDAPLGLHLAAYVAPKRGWLLEIPALRAALRERLPDYMAPTAWRVMEVGELPLTPNGKVDRRALSRLAGEAGSGDAGFVAPRGPIEEMVAAVFAEVLGLERVGALDDFFALGGQSLLATRVISRLRRAFGVEIEVRVLLERPTVEGLAAWVAAARRGDVPQAPPILPQPFVEGGLPLSSAQERLWFIQQLDPGSTLYNLPMVFRLSGPLDAAALEAALAEVERRYAVLRTVFVQAADGPRQIARPPALHPLSRLDLAALPAPAREAETARLALEESRRPFDLEREPVWRRTLLRLAADEHRLLLSIHHVATDGWSMEILVRELSALYAAASAGKASPLPEPVLQYADYAAWQRGWLAGEILEREIDHWRRELAGAPFVLGLPTDYPRPAVQSHRGGLERTAIGAELEAAARELARKSAATPFMVFLAAFQALLGRYSGQEDVLAGFPVAGRSRVETEGLIGLFVNTLVLRGRLAGNPGFGELVSRVREAALAAFAHQDVPFEKLVEELAPERDLSRNAVFQALFLFQGAAPPARELAPGLTLEIGETAGELAKFDLKLALEEDGGGLAAFWEYAADLFEPATVRRLGSHFVRLLAGAVRDPEAPVAELPLMSEEELRQVVLVGEGRAGAGLLHERFAAWAARTPDAPAVAFEGEVLTYAELAARAGRLARRLRRLGVGPEVAVGVCCERSTGMIAALLGVLQAGGAYVPLDPGFPGERLAFQLEDSRARVLVTEEGLAGRLPETLPRVLLDRDEPAAAAEEDGPPASSYAPAGPENLAYVIYTSGSTGRPKGVMVEHGNLVHYLDGALARMALPEGASYATVSTIAADLGNTVIFAALATGGLLHVISGERLGDPARLAEYFDRNPVDALKIVPSHLAALMTGERPGRVLPRRLLVTGGEALPWPLAGRVRALAPGCRVLNHYGPTETTVGVLAFPASESGAERRSPRSPIVPLGRPLGATRAVVVDARLQPVPPGVAGELLAGGPQVTRGYLDRPDLTAERFVPDPFSGEPGARLYRTGDLVRLLPEGEIDFLGRIDHQVKVRGFRVEPGEIEAALRAQPGVREALALVRTTPEGENRLVAYVVPSGHAEGLAAELRRRLREILPEALVPGAFVTLPAIPLTPNGKVDRAALPEPGEAAATAAGAPLGPVEEVVAGVFAQLLGLDRVEADGDFFALGGHSLLATRALSMLRRAFGVDLELRAVFEASTVAGLARRIEERLGSPLAAAPALVPRPRPAEGMPLSFAQESLWFLDRLQPGAVTYNVPRRLRLRGDLSVPALATALGEIARRHEVLRTVYAETGDGPRQRPLPLSGFPLPVVDLAALPEPARSEEEERLTAREARRPVDLAAGPLLRALLLRRASGEHALLAFTHHIASDGASMGVFARELSALYGAAAAGRPSPLPPLPVQFADFAAWEREWLSGPTLEAEIDWWRRRLGGAAGGLDLPADRPRRRKGTARGAVEPFSLPAALAAGLERLGRSRGATLFMTLLAAFQTLLHRYTGEEDVRVGTSVAGRGRPEVEELIGYFVNTLVLRGDLSGRPGFEELLDRVRAAALGAYAHQHLPFAKLVEALAPDREEGQNPLFQAAFALERPAAPPVLELGPGLAAALDEPLVGAAKFDLTLALETGPSGLGGLAEYSADRFDASTVRRLLGHFRNLLAGVAADPRRPLAELPLLGEEERQQMLREWSGAEAADAAARPVEERIAGWAARTPEAAAVVAEDGAVWTFAELEARAAALARRLRRLGVGPETVAGVLLDRSPETIAVLLAVLRAGGAYLPLDAALPVDRLGYMLADSGASVLLTRRSVPAALQLAAAGLPMIDLDDLANPPETAGAVEEGAAADPSALAYVLYTSGSTGRPKGVGVPRRGLAERTAAMVRRFELAPGDRALQFASLGFDVAAEEIFPTLASGATLVLVADPRQAGAGLAARIERERITVVNLPSPVWHEWVEELAAAGSPPPACLRLAVVGSDVVSPERVVQWRRLAGGRVALLNAYGLTETTVTATVHRVERDPGPEDPRVPVGRPVAGVRVYVVDSLGALVPPLVSGELWIGGSGLARGYAGRPELTAERFVPDLFATLPGARLYRTGDLARRRGDGEIELLGRIDAQVKVRGVRIEPGEIETALGGHPGIAEAAVGVRREAGGGLVAYLVPREAPAPEPAELRRFLEARLAAAMIPARFAFLEALPLTPNGKLDRAALARVPLEEEPAGETAEPRTPAERTLAGLFANLLGLERVGVEEDFFQIGGHSLLAARLVARVRQAFGVELPLGVVFDAPTVAGLARWIEAAGRVPEAPPALAASGPRTLPASFAQRRFWFLDRLMGASAAYNMPSALRVHGPLRPAALAAALDELVRRHEVLRTVYGVEEGEPVQVVLPFEPRGLPVIDLAACPAERREGEAARLEPLWGRRPFDLERGPVFRAALVRLSGEEHVLLLNLHHIASDGWSREVMYREIGALYRAFAAGRPSPLPALPLQYGDYAAWQRGWLSGEVLAEQLAFWRSAVGTDPEPLELPADRPRPAVQSGRGALARRPLPLDFGTGLERLGRERGATPFISFLAAFQALLHRYTGREELIVGTPVANRDRLDVEGLIGCFVNTLALRAGLAGDPSFPELLERTRRGALAAYAHQDLPFERLVEELVTGRDLSRTPLCQVTFALQHGQAQAPDLGPGLRMEWTESHSGTAKFDLAVFLGRFDDRAELQAELATDLFEAGTVERLLGHLAVLVGGIEARPEARISELPLLSAGERAQLLAWNAETAERPRSVEPLGSTLHGLFEAQAARTPDAIALIAGNERLSYAELEARSGELVGVLRGLGVGPEVPVGIFLEREAGLIVALLATLRAGGFYVPLDPNYPAERVAFMLEDSGCAVILTTPDLEDRLPESRARIVRLDGEIPAAPPRGTPPVLPGNLSYVIYTSGSTGHPKAVAIEHRSVVALMLWSRREYSDLELSGVLASTSITFDMSVFEIFAPLCWGGTVILGENALALPELAVLPADHQVRVVDTVPSAMAELLRMGGVPDSVVTVNLGGEAVPRALADRVHAQPTIERLYNVYGPSEDTTFSTWAPIDRSDRPVSIGRPLDGEQAWVVDRHFNPVPVGVPGELYLAGEGLSRGYLGRPELTADRFLPNPFSTAPGARMYRVGDLVRYRPDGELEYLGRLDHQVKVRGFRVELGEVESALIRLPGVASAAVLARQDDSLGLHLAACVAPAGVDVAALREGLRAQLPEYMVPTAWKAMAALPLTPNGKIDRRALAQVAPGEGLPGAGSREPATSTERRLAGLFTTLLKLEGVGAEDNFFHLGGHSLLAARLVARVRETFEVEMPLRAVFESPTVAGLARWIEGARRGQGAPLLLRTEGARSRPVSFAQQRLWLLDRLMGAAATYNMPAVFRLRGELRPAALAAALDEIVRRHEVLRTVYGMEEGEPVQIVQPFVPRGLPVVDLAACPEAEARLIAEWSRRPFDLEGGPLFRAALLRRSAAEHVLLLNVHHIASDGWSYGVLGGELGDLYRAFAAGLPSPLPELPVQYGDYAAWQRRWLSGEVLAEQLAFWRSRLGTDPDPLELPADHPRPPVQSGRGSLARRRFPAGFGDGLERLGRSRGATAFMAFLGASQALLYRYTGREELIVGTPAANRDRLDVEGLIGCFVNTLALRVDLAGDPPFPALLDRVRETALSAFAHQDLPFERLVEELVSGRDLSRPPLCQVLFTFQTGTARVPDLGPGLGVEPGESLGGSAKFDLSLFLGRSGERVEMLAEYATDLFEAATVERLLGHLAVLVEGIGAHPEARISELPLLGEAERDQLAGWNAETGRRERPLELLGSTLPGLFEAQAARTPDGVALIAGNERLSYAELEARSGELARRLRGLGAGPEVPVGIFLEREAGLIVAMLAALRAGGFYVPLDPAYPADRVAFMLEDSGCAVVLTTSDLEARLPANSARIVRLDEEASHVPSLPASPVLPGNLAYVIYTSGSTGRPKAVAIEHRSAVALMLWSRREYSDLELSGVLASTSITFDMSVFEIFAPLCWGGTVILAGNALALPELAVKDRVRVVDTVPSAMAELLRMKAVPASVVTVNLGGEAVPRALAQRIHDQPNIERLYNVYGPSEDTTFSTWALIDRSDRPVSIGRPLDGEQAWVVDRHFNPVPVGVPGELYLAGEGLSRGYLGRPELTAERFLPNPFSAIPGARMYRVGDLVRYRPDGELEYLGRLDHQVKIRGFRVELGEVESALARLPGVASAAVLARQDDGLGLHLAAYVAPAGVDAVALREGLRSRLPEYMVPTAWKSLEALPLTPNGKVDRRALARLAAEAGPADRERFLAPRGPVEERLAEIFAGLLGLERVGAEDDFFLRGGHSLLAARLVARVREAFEADLPLRAVFEAPTVAGLARRVEAARNGLSPAPVHAARREGEGLPASFSQARIWLLDRLRPGSGTYNIPAVFRVHGPLRPAVLGWALDEIVRRHEVLRTIFSVLDGQPLQVVQPFAPHPLPVADLARLPAPARAAEASRLAREWSARPFDLERGPVIRAGLLRLAAGEHLLLLNVHHVAYDGWSSGILVQELGTLYQAAAAGHPSPLPPLPMQYADYAVWQREWLQGGALEEQLAFWRARLGNDPEPLELPADHPRPAVQSGRGEVEQRTLPAAGSGLERLAREKGATTFMAFLAVFQTLLHRYTGRGELSVGTPVANRDRVEVEGLIGCFVNTLVLHTDLEGDPAFPELLERVRETALSAYAHQDTPFERLVEELVPGRDLSRPPLCQVAFSFQQEAAGVPAFGPELRVEMEGGRGRTAKFDLSLFLGRFGEDTALLAEYSTDLFERTTVRRLLGHFEVLLRGIEEEPGRRLSELPLLTPAERDQLLVEWTATAAEYPAEVPVHRLFTLQAERSPDAPAVIAGERTLSYAELDGRASRAAAVLRQAGVGPGTAVALVLDRSVEMVVACLAVLKAGGFYVPLDPRDPAERLRFVLEDTRAAVVVAREDGLVELPHPPRFLPVEALDGGAPEGPLPETSGEHLAYVIYTSGSTGRPKGVAVPHRAINRLVLNTDYVRLGPGDRVGHLSNPAFDAAVFEIWGPLLNGGSVVVIPRDTALAPAALASELERRRVTVLFLTTALFNLMARESPRAFAGLRDLFFGGEATDPQWVKACLETGPPERLLNVYGPTESTTFATWQPIASARPGEAVPIGRPIANTRAYVADRRLHPLPVGVPGELLLGGDGLAHGYLGRPELTAERFVPDPFGPAGGRLYRTGDLVRLRPSGEIEFLGRIDQQIKLRGFRIELGEIEAALNGLPGVATSAVMVREETGEKRLVAYVVGAPDASLSPNGLREELRGRLPEYMVPAVFVFLDALPLTPNGKVNRRALPAPEINPDTFGPEFVAPRTPLEAQIAEVWAAVLGVEKVGLDDTFWDLGGHSLLATRVLSRLYEALGVELPLQALFEHPTLVDFAETVGQAILATGGEEVDRFLEELEGLSEEEIRELLQQEESLEPGS